MMNTVTGDLINYFFNAKYAIAILEEENHNMGHEKKSEDELIEPKLYNNFDHFANLHQIRKKTYGFHFSCFNNVSDIGLDIENPPEA